MGKTKIAILGGGMASLAAAYELTRTEELRALHDVTVYQMGWRLGGKCASGRNPRAGQRIEEHGLHVWFGFYENAFALIKDVYAHRTPAPGNPIKTWRDALVPQNFTPIGDEVNGQLTWWPLTWPTNADEPGDGQVLLSPWGAVTEMMSLVANVLESWLRGTNDDDAGFALIPDWIEEKIDDALDRWIDRLPGLFAALPSPALGRRVVARVFRKAVDLALSWGPDPTGLSEDVHSGLAKLLKTFKGLFFELVKDEIPRDAFLRHVWLAIDLSTAMISGLLDPRYGIMKDMNLDRIDHYEFRAWMLENGASREVIEKSHAVRALYDTCFAYDKGDLTRPNYAAGTAVRVILRIVGTYKSSVLFLMTAGMGDVVITPLYEVLASRGVKFEFFHKVERLELTPDKALIGKIHLALQAKPKAGAYQPLVVVDGMPCWPSFPLWDQLENGAEMEAAGVNFESNWNQWPAAGRVTLELGDHFDKVVLGISLGAFKKLNGQPTMCDELREASQPFRDMVDHLGLVPTQAVQLWVDRDLEGLGWRDRKPAMVAGPEALDIWADMSQTLAREQWSGTKPRSVHFFCGVLPTTLFEEPTTDATVPARALALVRQNTVTWFDSYTASIWPLATQGSGPHPHGLDWSVLHDPAGRSGEARLDAQYIRANVDPTECCITSLAGTTRYRLWSHESGFDNLYLAGDWIRTGINAACVEGAVMSGMQASRAICGSPAVIVGEDFFGPKPVLPPPRSRPRARAAVTDSAPPPAPRPAPAPSASGVLPRYVSRYGHGEQVVLPPGLVQRARNFVFAVPAEPAKLSAFVREQLAAPTRGAWDFRVLGSTVLVSFMDAQKLTSTAETVGYLPDRECAFWVPLAAKDNATGHERLVFWMPYIFVDTSIAMATGREVWGFAKEIGALKFPEITDAEARFVTEATIFTRFDQSTKGEFAKLVEVHKGGSTLGPLDEAWHDATEALQGIVAALEAGGAALIGGDWDLIENFFRQVLSREVPMVNLKQFRDAKDPTCACYQALIESACRLERVHAGGLLGGDYVLDITPCDSHPIARDLGLSTGTGLEVKLALWIDMDFSVLPGTEIWKAR
jgi:uncharacterized protein with NAD-binding domain and iron-sulfur cluster